MNEFITIKQAAKILGVHPITLRRWDKNGKLQAVRHRFNGYRLYIKKDVEKLAAKITEKYAIKE